MAEESATAENSANEGAARAGAPVRPAQRQAAEVAAATRAGSLTNGHRRRPGAARRRHVAVGGTRTVLRFELSLVSGPF
jgi:hypothetical protein